MSHGDRHRPDGPDDRDGDAPVTPAEQARAEAFGRWLDGLAAGEPLPPAMDSDDRALLETATMVMASSHAVELGPERARSLINEALESAVLGRSGDADADALADSDAEADFDLGMFAGGRVPARRPGPVAVRAVPRAADAGDERDPAAGSSTDLVNVRRRRADRVLRHLPWAVASLAAAAAVILFVTRPAVDQAARETPARPLRLGVANTSRPADPLIGIIARKDAGRASERLDVLFADRMDGYRDLTLRRALGKEQP